MTNYIKVNGEWIKNRVYAIVDAAHTRFSSTKFTATNVSDALDEIADSISGGSGGGNKITVAETAPVNPSTGDMWVDTDDEETGSIPIAAVSGLPSALDGKQATLPSGTNYGDLPVWNGIGWVTKPYWQIKYRPVEYIESTGTQYIDTKCSVTSNIRVVIEEAYTNLDSIEYSLEGSSSGNFFSWGIPSFKDYFRSRIDNGSGSGESVWPSTGVSIDTDFHTWDLQSGSQKFDGVEYSTRNVVSFNSNLYIFGRHAGSNVEYSENKVKVCRIYNGETLIRNLIPCYRILDNAIGMYDLITDEFYGNSGSGTFLKGADI